MAPPKSTEPTVTRNDPMPPGYVFLPKGSTYITANCRMQTRAANKTVYVVIDPVKKRQTGIRVPRFVHAAVSDAEQDTRSDRATAVEKKDASTARKFEQAVLRLFPNVPTDALPRMVKHALVKRSKRVARVGALEEAKKVRLAVWAHVRHCCTDYDKLLREGVSRETAREKVKGRIEQTIKDWSGRTDGKEAAKPTTEPTKPTMNSGRPMRRASIDAQAKTKEMLSPRKKKFEKTETMVKEVHRIDKAGGQGGQKTTGGGRETASTRDRTAPAINRFFAIRDSQATVGDKDDLANVIVIESDSEPDLMYIDTDSDIFVEDEPLFVDDDEMDWQPEC